MKKHMHYPVIELQQVKHAHPFRTVSFQMSRQTDTLPQTARSIALLLASTPTIQDAQPGVLHQLLEFSHRYTAQVLSDALVYAEHAGRSTKINLDDIVLAVQARVGWEFGGRVPKEYIMSLASETNAQPLPSVPEVFGVRLPPSSEQLTAIDFNLVPNKPPPTVKIYDEEIEEVEESESELDTEHDGADLGEEDDQDEDMEPTPLPSATIPAALPPHLQQAGGAPAVTTYAPATATAATDVEMAPTPADGEGDAGTDGDGSDVGDDEDGLFAGGDDDNDDDEPMGDTAASGAKRKLVEEDDYD